MTSIRLSVCNVCELLWSHSAMNNYIQWSTTNFVKETFCLGKFKLSILASFAFSTPVFWCHDFHSRVFHSCIFDAFAISIYEFSVAPSRRQYRSRWRCHWQRSTANVVGSILTAPSSYSKAVDSIKMDDGHWRWSTAAVRTLQAFSM